MGLRGSVVFMATLALPMAHAQQCTTVRGRAVMYSADGKLVLWQRGTHHTFQPADKASFDLVCSYLDCNSRDKQPALFADFTLCPTEPYKAGATQRAVVKKVRHTRVDPDWKPSPARSAGR